MNAQTTLRKGKDERIVLLEGKLIKIKFTTNVDAERFYAKVKQIFLDDNWEKPQMQFKKERWRRRYKPDKEVRKGQMLGRSVIINDRK